MKKLYLDWKLGYSETMEAVPEEWIPAHVPGGAQLDYAEAHGYPSHLKGLNYKKYLWMEDVCWKYEAPFEFKLSGDEKAYLHFDGIDYRYEIRIDDELLLLDEGMFSHIHLDVSRFANAAHTLHVNLFPVPKADDSNDRNQARKSVKSAACYSWDWHPRLVTSGIWDEAYLEIEKAPAIENLEISYRLSDDFRTAELQLQAKLSDAAPVSVQIDGPDGEKVFEQVYQKDTKDLSTEIDLENIALWYPTGYGAQPLYQVTVCSLSDSGAVLSEKKRRIGFKRTQLLMNEGSWDEPALFPKSRSDAPAALAVNGQRIFARGSNIVCTRIYPGTMTKEIYECLLTLVKDANMNILRIWGGGFINKECFYDLCDEMGILIWQEFPLACNEYPDDRDYIKVLEKEANAIVKRLRTHPCLAFWCGGNELFNDWSLMTDQHHALRLLDSVTFTEDRDTPFIMTSPLNGMAHGCYCNYDPATKEESMQLFERSHNTAYTEFGCGGVSDLNTLKAQMTEEEFEELVPGNENWAAHHNFDGWRPEQANFADVDYFFGGYKDLADLSEKTQFLQAMSYRSNFEEMRRQWPHCAMALNWCFNEAWPMICSLAIVSYPDKPRPSYFAVKEALRPQIASLKVKKQVFWTGEEWNGEIYVINDTLDTLPGSTVNVSIEAGGREKKLGEFPFEAVGPQQVVKLGSVTDVLPYAEDGFLTVRLTVSGREDMSSEYRYVLRKTERIVNAKKYLNE